MRTHSPEREEVVFQREQEEEVLQQQQGMVGMECKVKTEGLEMALMEVEGGVEEGWVEDHQKASYQDTHYQEEMAQALADGSIGERKCFIRW